MGGKELEDGRLKGKGRRERGRRRGMGVVKGRFALEILVKMQCNAM